MRRALIVVCALVIASACNDSKNASEETEAGPAFRLAAPPTCLSDPTCAPAVARGYGADLSPGLVPVKDAAEAVKAVREGQADLAAVPGTDPVLTDDDLVVMADPKAITAPDVLLPIVTPATAKTIGGGVAEAVKAVGDALSTEELQSLAREVAVSRRDAGAVARAWADAKQLTANRRSGLGSTVSVGVTESPESRVIGEAFVQVLATADVPASVVTVGSSRSTVLDAVQRGAVTMAFDWSWSLLEHLDGHRGLAPGDADATIAALDRYLNVIGLSALGRGSASRGFVYVTSPAIAQARGIASLEDVARLSPRDGGPGPDAPPVPDLVVGSVTTDLGIGASGTEVRRLQARIAALNLDLGPGFAIPQSGTFDELTRRALANIQRRAGLPATGVYDAATKRVFDQGLPPERPPLLASGTGGSIDPSANDPGPPDPTTTTAAPSTTVRRGRRPPATTTTIRAGTAGVVHLVFAGGPDGNWTPDVVELLRQYDAHATFAMTASGVGANPITTKRIREAGHGLAVSTDEHVTADAPAATEHLIAEATGTADQIEAAAGNRPRCMVPPYGATGDDTLKRVKESGFETVLWDIDPQDWRNPSPRAMADTTIATMRSGDVILLHDGGGNRAQTITLLRTILEDLKTKGIAARPLCR